MKKLIDEDRKQKLIRIEDELYNKCYRGHLPDEFWEKLAEFCLMYAERENEKSV